MIPVISFTGVGDRGTGGTFTAMSIGNNEVALVQVR